MAKSIQSLVHSVVHDGTQVELDSIESSSTPNSVSHKVKDIGAIDKAPDGNPDSSTEAGRQCKLVGMNHLQRPLLRVLAGSPICKLNLSKVIRKRYSCWDS
ncbi:hypothetical protein PanWU01x14_029220 [Parasponia andersonii]|uniref:Uncharacterized protein n=1 Tax=Parasponia andersonii TaxID=3476 RepID=A0A2P5DVH3_PARAD|nr:hypothetical protein PanWU01x14_029220 [Parasponia andersonii]